MKTATLTKIPYDNKSRADFATQKSAQLRTRASSLYHELVTEGYMPNDIISLSAQLLSFVTADLKMKK